MVTELNLSREKGSAFDFLKDEVLCT